MSWTSPREIKIKQALPLPTVVVNMCLDYLYDTSEVIYNQPSITPQNRVILSDWIYEVLAILNITHERRLKIWLHWVILHRTAMRNTLISKHNYQLFGVACLYCADSEVLEMNKKNKTTLQFATYISDHAFTQKSFIRMIHNVGIAARIHLHEHGEVEELEKLQNIMNDACDNSEDINWKYQWSSNDSFPVAIFRLAIPKHKIKELPSGWKGRLSLLKIAGFKLCYVSGIGEKTMIILQKNPRKKPKNIRSLTWEKFTFLRGY
jgi:hypothetical protein